MRRRRKIRQALCGLYADWMPTVRLGRRFEFLPVASGYNQRIVALLHLQLLCYWIIPMQLERSVVACWFLNGHLGRSDNRRRKTEWDKRHGRARCHRKDAGKTGWKDRLHEVGRQALDQYQGNCWGVRPLLSFTPLVPYCLLLGEARSGLLDTVCDIVIASLHC